MDLRTPTEYRQFADSLFQSIRDNSRDRDEQLLIVTILIARAIALADETAVVDSIETVAALSARAEKELAGVVIGAATIMRDFFQFERAEFTDLQPSQGSAVQ